MFVVYFWLFFFKQKTAYEMRISDWSSDVCSSDLAQRQIVVRGGELTRHGKGHPAKAAMCPRESHLPAALVIVLSHRRRGNTPASPEYDPLERVLYGAKGAPSCRKRPVTCLVQTTTRNRASGTHQTAKITHRKLSRW